MLLTMMWFGLRLILTSGIQTTLHLLRMKVPSYILMET